MAMPAATSFVIDTELSPAYYDEPLKFIHHNYLLSKPEAFGSIRRKRSGGVLVLSFVAFDPNRTWQIEARMTAGKPIHVEMTPKGPVPEGALDGLREDLMISVQSFEESIRKSTLYFAWIQGERIVPEEPPSAKRRASDRLFSSNMLMLYVLLLAVNIVLFIFLGIYGVLATLAIQFGFVLFADKVYARMGNLKITEKNQTAHILQYQLPAKEYEEFRRKFGKDAIKQMKTEIYDRTLALGMEPTCELGEDVFEKYGMRCTPERRSAKAVNVYRIVKTAAGRYDMPMPKIVISNSMMPNAAATGPSPGRGVILITTGLLVELEDDEILSVVGHELGHLQGRDPLILFGLTSAEFVLRVFVFLPFFLYSPFLYLVFAMGIVYFIAKFFEARADLQSALKIGQPKALAEALEKIGFQKLQYERIPTFKIQSWLRWDPHPPTYFRVDRLQKMSVPTKTSHPLLQSAKDVFNGFRSAI